ncbi:MAG: recombination protein RecR [Bacteroidales bacterium]|nr:recombination protein RecR [Bacteroidales bacterium]
MQEKYPSKLLHNVVRQFAQLPGIGERTALRLVLHLLRSGKENTLEFSSSIQEFIEGIRFCSVCYNISDTEVCPICSSGNRDRTLVCVVENVKDVMAIENTQQYKGLYHVLGGLISPMEGLGPNDLQIIPLIQRIKEDEVREVILALSATMEGDTTNYYLYRKLNEFPVKISMIARGVSFGDEIEYTNELTLGKSILNRTPFDGSHSGS